MYNRYIRSEDGSYTRIAQSEPISPPEMPHPQAEAPPSPGMPPRHDSESKRNEQKFLDRILEKLHLEDIDSADLMLLALLFFLFEEKADDELLIALGLLLIL